MSVIAVLILSEFVSYLETERRDRLYVDTSKQTKIEIYLNITFPAISCDGEYYEIVTQD